MILFQKHLSFRILFAALACLGSGGALFELGYWEGQHSFLKNREVFLAVPRSEQTNNPASSNGVAALAGSQPCSFPADASSEMKEFLQNRAILIQKSAELRRSNPNGPPDAQKLAQYERDNAALFQRQKELSQILSQQQATSLPTTPAPLQMPLNASPQLQAYLTARDQLMRDQIAFINLHRTDDPATRQAAMREWREQNATRFQQLQQEAQALTQTTVTTTR